MGKENYLISNKNMGNNWKIIDETIKVGEKIQTLYKPKDYNFTIPVTLINGEHDGKTVLISAGIHGSEYVGIQAAIEMANELDPKDVHGKIIILHPANLSAFLQRTFAIVPEDGKNLNRVFPGNPDGSFSEQLAYIIRNEFQKKADFYLDMHCGDLHEALTPLVFYPGTCKEEVLDESLRIAKVLNLPYRLRSMLTTGTHTSIAVDGCPALLIERGELGLWSQEEVEAYKKDIKSALFHLDVLLENPYPNGVMEQHEVTNSVFLSSDVSGCWYPNVTKGEKIQKGQLLGEVRDYFGKTIKEFYAESSGVILYLTISLAIDKDIPLITYATIV